jgi:hypothetical protein
MKFLKNIIFFGCYIYQICFSNSIVNDFTNITAHIETLYNNENNFLKINQDFIIDTHSFTKPIVLLNENYLNDENIKSYIDLFDLNINPDLYSKKNITKIMKKKINNFLLNMKNEKSFQSLMKILNKSDNELIDLIYNIFFTIYDINNGREETYAFEHIFLHQTKNDIIEGLHNWIYFYEHQNNVTDVKIFNKNDNYFTLTFKFNNLLKAMDSFFVGSSPMFEMSIITLIYSLTENLNNKVIDIPFVYNKNNYFYRLVRADNGNLITCYLMT